MRAPQATPKAPAQTACRRLLGCRRSQKCPLACRGRAPRQIGGRSWLGPVLGGSSLGSPLVPFDLIVLGGTPIPEPSTVVLAALGLVSLAFFRRRRR
ncbi:MAG: PEP-CTERM sorting domain-containing protein [Planctomycetota bacterium]|nr:MAG: PEP-CTERM sorting domain-containing protein [Planctomycetota bacterium]